MRVTINDGERVLEAEEGRPLLFTAMQNRIFIPSACGGRASCGQCRVRVVSPRIEHLPEERSLLGPEEMARGVHLACQCRVHSDLHIELPRGYLQARPYRGTVTSLRDVARDMREIEVDLGDPSSMSFRAGQYVQFVLTGTENDPQPVYRAYSMASPPSRAGRLTLLFSRVPGGACTSFVFERLTLGQEVTVNGPFGSFYIREGRGPLVLVAGGSGIAPVRGMLLEMAERDAARPVTFLFSAHTRADLVYQDDMSALESRLRSFRFIPVLSRPAADDRWEGERGSLPAALVRLLPRLDQYEAYLCGGPGLIQASIEAMKSRGLADEHVFFDKFS